MLNLGGEYISRPEVEKIKNHFRINDERRWQQERTTGITVYNLITIEVNYPKIKEEVL